jgi:hypothetical protein
VSLAGAVSSINTPTSSNTTPTTSAETTGIEDAAAASQTGLDGEWAVATDGETFVGYRVGESSPPSAPPPPSAGPRGSATVEIADGLLVAVQVEADLTALESDNSMRDGQLRNQAIETSTYPTHRCRHRRIELPRLGAGEAVTSMSLEH